MGWLVHLCLPLSFLLSVGDACGATYPDVWDWRPQSPPKEWASVDFHRMPDGDILLTYWPSYKDAARNTQVLTFFGRREFRSTEEAFGVAPGAVHPPPDRMQPARLPNGKIITTISAEECSRGLGSQVRVNESDYRSNVRKTFLVLLDRPKQSLEVRCEETRQPGFRYTLGVLRPQRVLPLADNTFLVSDLLTGTVLRLDDDLNTRSPLLGTRVFSMNPEELEQLVRRYYRPAPAYGVYWQRFFDDLRARLLPTAK